MHLTTTEFGLPNEHVVGFLCAQGLTALWHLEFATRKLRQLPNRGNSMMVKTTNRSHRVAYIVALLLLAVALTTALVMAAEQDSQSEKQMFHQSDLTESHSLPQGPMGWECT